ncbi:MAG: patatin family protein [Pseudomonadota bacterium]
MEEPSPGEKPESSVRTALIVEGGAMRGIFTTGVLDGFLEAGFNPFDLFIGVSSGAGNLAAYLAQMPRRNFRIYTDYSLRSEFISFRRFLRGGHLLDLDWLWSSTIREIRLDLKTIYTSGRPFLVCVTDAGTGRAEYKSTAEQNLEDVLKASSAIPVLYRGFPLVDGRPSTDGGISDPIPVARAIHMGACRIMVLRSRPRDYHKKEGVLQAALIWKLRRFPLLQEALRARVDTYNSTVSLIRRPPPGVCIVEICPPPDFRPGRLSRSPEHLIQGYHQGLAMAREAMGEWGAHEIQQQEVRL